MLQPRHPLGIQHRSHLRHQACRLQHNHHRRQVQLLALPHPISQAPHQVLHQAAHQAVRHLHSHRQSHLNCQAHYQATYQVGNHQLSHRWDHLLPQQCAMFARETLRMERNTYIQKNSASSTSQGLARRTTSHPHVASTPASRAMLRSVSSSR